MNIFNLCQFPTIILQYWIVVNSNKKLCSSISFRECSSVQKNWIFFNLNLPTPHNENRAYCFHCSRMQNKIIFHVFYKLEMFYIRVFQLNVRKLQNPIFPEFKLKIHCGGDETKFDFDGAQIDESNKFYSKQICSNNARIEKRSEK